MKQAFSLLVLVAALLLSTESATSGLVCQAGRTEFELLVNLRMLNYASMSDSWSKRAQKWAKEISENNETGRHTPSLDSAYRRFSRYCDQGDDFMAGLTLESGSALPFVRREV